MDESVPQDVLGYFKAEYLAILDTNNASKSGYFLYLMQGGGFKLQRFNRQGNTKDIKAYQGTWTVELKSGCEAEEFASVKTCDLYEVILTSVSFEFGENTKPSSQVFHVNFSLQNESLTTTISAFDTTFTLVGSSKYLKELFHEETNRIYKAPMYRICKEILQMSSYNIELSRKAERLQHKHRHLDALNVYRGIGEAISKSMVTHKNHFVELQILLESVLSLLKPCIEQAIQDSQSDKAFLGEQLQVTLMDVQRWLESIKKQKEDIDPQPFQEVQTAIQEWITKHAFAQKPIIACANCGDHERIGGGSLLKCSRCKLVDYCSKECQVEHWSEHKNTCISNSQ